MKYHSFEELAAAYGVKQKQQNKDKLKARQDKFLNRHRCPVCKEPMVYIGGSIMTCKNKACKSEETPFEILDERGAEIAENIFK